ncbi:MAG: NUDIX domain-containing protein [Candidatus Bipolaricaulia bacterium]
MPHYYVESDGQVFLVDDGRRLRFPESEQEMDFEIVILREMKVDGEPVLYCKPILEDHPYDWLNKDRIPLLDRVDPIVHGAINASLPRIVVEAIVRQGDQILLVKPKRGVNRGRWTLPGGFLTYGEPPEAGVLRELEEEVGVRGRVERLLGLKSGIGHWNYYLWCMLFYEVGLESEQFRPAPDEIEAVRWFPFDEAIEIIDNVMIQDKLMELYETERSQAQDR